jgi:hypothetical protein
VERIMSGELQPQLSLHLNVEELVGALCPKPRGPLTAHVRLQRRISRSSSTPPPTSNLDAQRLRNDLAGKPRPSFPEPAELPSLLDLHRSLVRLLHASPAH